MKNGLSRKIVSIALSVVLAVGLCPGLAAAKSDSAAPELVGAATPATATTGALTAASSDRHTKYGAYSAGSTICISHNATSSGSSGNGVPASFNDRAGAAHPSKLTHSSVRLHVAKRTAPDAPSFARASDRTASRTSAGREKADRTSADASP